MTSKQWVDIYHKEVPTLEDKEKVDMTIKKLQENFIIKTKKHRIDNPNGLTNLEIAKRLSTASRKCSLSNVTRIVGRLIAEGRLKKDEKISKN